jgi:hypothetical protein
MKPFLLGLIAAVGIALGAHYAIGTLNWSAEAKYSAPSVRL